VENLLAGYRRFREQIWPAERMRYEMLSERGQRPQTLVVSCSDSRVDPPTVFGAAPGELFVIRNVAGLVPPYQPDGGCHGTSAALEFGVRVLQVARIVVLGHAQCGGVRAAVEGAPPEASDFVAPWMALAGGVLECAPTGTPNGASKAAPGTASHAERLSRCELAIVRLSLRNLRTFPWIAQAVAAGRLTLHGMQFDIHTGVLANVGPDGLEPID
jgi:carbonic anhydrase